jgi:hypothetical protein
MAGVASARVANRHALALGLLQRSEKKNVTAWSNVYASGFRHAATQFSDKHTNWMRTRATRDENSCARRQNWKNRDETRSFDAIGARYGHDSAT